MKKIYDFKSLTSKGKEVDFSQFEGKVLLIVNTASKCGFTPQFAGLEELNQKYKDKGLVIIGFPCNQFKEQDPGNDTQIEEFCQVNYGVTFQIMKKIDVNGANAEPIFEYLKAQAPTEEYHGLKVDETVMGDAIRLAKRYLTEKSLPDSAFVQGAVTDEEGTFKIATNLSKGILKLSCIGYETLYLDYKVANGLTIQMKEDTKILGEESVAKDLSERRCHAYNCRRNYLGKGWNGERCIVENSIAGS